MQTNFQGVRKWLCGGLNQNHKISFQTYLLLCEELNFEDLVFEQELNALEYVTKHNKKRRKRVA
jgi:hypothetical protein